MNRKKSTIAAGLLATCFALTLHAPLAAQKVDETYTAIAMNMSAGPGPAAGRMTLRIKDWTSDEKRAELLKILAEKGSDAVAAAIAQEPEIGNFNFPGTLGYTLRYARSFQKGEERHLILATDRWIANVELRSGARTLDYPLTIVHLVLGPDGKGTGEILVGAQLTLNQESNEITIQHWGTQPVKLTSVALQEKKKK